MTHFLHTMVRITDPDRSRAFYEALGFDFSSEFDIVRDGQREATNYFFSLGDQQNVLELTSTTTAAAATSGRGTATSRWAWTASTARSHGSASRGSSRSVRPTRCARAARASASSRTRTDSF
jgi:catechol 2,3-dioxygenase-like lactoylglutathione lyase family enzyme